VRGVEMNRMREKCVRGRGNGRSERGFGVDIAKECESDR